MPKSFQQKLKILYLMRVFSEKTDEAHPMSVKDLISYLESLGIHAERKTIYDDIETLRVFGMDIMNRRERPSGFYLASREFETAELKLLVDAVQFSRFLTVGKSRQLIQKLEHLTSIYQAKDLQRQAIVLDQVKNTNESIYYNVDEIHRAISQNRQISFQYTEWTVSKEKHLKKGGARYQISPWQMIWQDGNYYLIGGREEKVNLEFENHLVGVMIDRFGQDIMIMSKDNEHSVTRVQVNVSTQFYGWLAALGNSVRVISPENVRKEYRDFLRKALENYEG